MHTHILPEHLPDLAARYGYGEWVRLDHHTDCGARMYKGGTFFREVEDNCYRVQPRLRDADATSVSVQVLSTVPVMFSYWAKGEDALDLSVFLNDHIHSVVQQQPHRFLGLCTVPMQAPALAVQELERCMALGFAGVQIGSHVNDLPLSDPSLFPVFEAAERLGAAVFVHPWDMAGAAVMSRYWLPWLVGMPAETTFAICSLIFGGVFRRLPRLRVCFAHGGGSFPGTIGRIEHGFLTRPDLVAVDNPVNPRDYCGHFWVDSLTHDEHALLHIRDLFGAQRIVLGSDYPFPLGEAQPGALIEHCAQLSDDERAAMLWDNAVHFLGVQKIERTLHGAPTGSGEDGTEVPLSNGAAPRATEDDDKEELERLHAQLDAAALSPHTTTG